MIWPTKVKSDDGKTFYADGSAPTQGADARPINQCDGCRAGHVIGQSGLHEYEGHGYMTCQAKRYVGADARPVAIDGMQREALLQVREILRKGNWKYYGEVVDELLATRDAAPSGAIKPREVKRDSDFSVTVVFSSCRLASEFERQMIAATAPREKT